MWTWSEINSLKWILNNVGGCNSRGELSLKLLVSYLWPDISKNPYNAAPSFYSVPFFSYFVWPRHAFYKISYKERLPWPIFFSTMSLAVVSILTNNWRCNKLSYTNKLWRESASWPEHIHPANLLKVSVFMLNKSVGGVNISEWPKRSAYSQNLSVVMSLLGFSQGSILNGNRTCPCNFTYLTLFSFFQYQKVQRSNNVQQWLIQF